VDQTEDVQCIFLLRKLKIELMNYIFRSPNLLQPYIVNATLRVVRCLNA
jgi:hypothetical protein